MTLSNRRAADRSYEGQVFSTGARARSLADAAHVSSGPLVTAIIGRPLRGEMRQLRIQTARQFVRRNIAESQRHQLPYRTSQVIAQFRRLTGMEPAVASRNGRAPEQTSSTDQVSAFAINANPIGER
jgi:hypothetical protein